MFPIALPPLRERRDDIPRLLQHVVARIARRLGARSKASPRGLWIGARAHAWPGNVRELENVVERALIMSRGGVLDGDGGLAMAPRAGAAAAAAPLPQASLLEVERAHIRGVLDATSKVIEGDAGAAQRLGLNPSTLRGRMRELRTHLRLERANTPTQQRS